MLWDSTGLDMSGDFTEYTLKKGCVFGLVEIGKASDDAAICLMSGWHTGKKSKTVLAQKSPYYTFL